MSDLNKELFDSLLDLDDKSVHFSQLSSIQESSLSTLRDQIKRVMIPLLIKAFQHQLDLIPSSRASSESAIAQETSLKEAYEQLKTLDYDLKNLQLWCQSCREQVQRALTLPDEEHKSHIATFHTEAHPGISKSFTDAMKAKAFSEETSSLKEKESSLPLECCSAKPWWRALIDLFRKRSI